MNRKWKHDGRAKRPKLGRDCDAQSSLHVPPLPNVLVLLPPNMPPPVLLPKALLVEEPKPDAEGELDRVRRVATGGRRRAAHCGRVWAEAVAELKEKHRLTGRSVVCVCGTESTKARGLGVVVGAEAAEAAAERHVEPGRGVGRA